MNPQFKEGPCRINYLRSEAERVCTVHYCNPHGNLTSPYCFHYKGKEEAQIEFLNYKYPPLIPPPPKKGQDLHRYSHIPVVKCIQHEIDERLFSKEENIYDC